MAGLIGAIAIAIVIIIIYGFRRLDHFLSCSQPIGSKTMVLEGWLPDPMKKEVCEHYWRNGYQRLIVTGGPIMEGLFLLGFKNYADLGAATMVALGIDPSQVVAVPAAGVDRYRTTAAAQALRSYILEHGIESFNLYTLGSHARRSHCLFRRVVGPQVAIGVVAIPDFRYESSHWWTTSLGVRTVMAEAIAYFYTRFIRWRD